MRKNSPVFLSFVSVLALLSSNFPLDAKMEEKVSRRFLVAPMEEGRADVRDVYERQPDLSLKYVTSMGQEKFRLFEERYVASRAGEKDEEARARRQNQPIFKKDLTAFFPIGVGDLAGDPVTMRVSVGARGEVNQVQIFDTAQNKIVLDIPTDLTLEDRQKIALVIRPPKVEVEKKKEPPKEVKKEESKKIEEIPIPPPPVTPPEPTPIPPGIDIEPPKIVIPDLPKPDPLPTPRPVTPTPTPRPVTPIPTPRPVTPTPRPQTPTPRPETPSPRPDPGRPFPRPEPRPEPGKPWPVPGVEPGKPRVDISPRPETPQPPEQPGMEATPKVGTPFPPKFPKEPEVPPIPEEELLTELITLPPTPTPTEVGEVVIVASLPKKGEVDQFLIGRANVYQAGAPTDNFKNVSRTYVGRQGDPHFVQVGLPSFGQVLLSDLKVPKRWWALFYDEKLIRSPYMEWMFRDLVSYNKYVLGANTTAEVFEDIVRTRTISDSRFIGIDPNFSEAHVRGGFTVGDVTYPSGAGFINIGIDPVTGFAVVVKHQGDLRSAGTFNDTGQALSFIFGSSSPGPAADGGLSGFITPLINSFLAGTPHTVADFQGGRIERSTRTETTTERIRREVSVGNRTNGSSDQKIKLRFKQ